MCPRRNATNIRLLLSALAEAASEKGTVCERTDRVARILAGDSDLDEYSSRVLDALFESIVYVVFNIPERVEENIKRLFTVIMNPSQVTASDDLLARIAGNASRQEIGGADQAPVIFRVESQISPKRLELISASWKRSWQEYAKLTWELQDRGIYTWNQYLLHGAGRPRPMGVIWSDRHSAAPPVDYFKLGADTLESMGTNPGLAANTQDNNLICDLPRDRDMWDFPLSDDVVARWINMLGEDDTIDVYACAKAGTYHLLRTYSCWGGVSFLSLPIIIAAGNGEGESSASSRMVISVCSNRPLNDQEILMWESIGHFVFPQLASGDLVTRHQAVVEQRERFLMQTRNLAHEIKNHTSPIGEDLDLGMHYLDEHHIEAFNGAKEFFARARRRLLLTNATARAIQFAVDQAKKPKQGEPLPNPLLYPLHRASVKITLEAILQLALSEITERRKDYTIRYSPIWNREKLKNGLLELIPVQDRAPLIFYEDVLQAAVSANRFVWAYALLREVLSNIKTVKNNTIDLESLLS